jgi:hypothetical protein
MAANEDSIVFRYVPAKTEIVSAPDEIKVSLLALVNAPKDAISIHFSEITFGEHPETVTYEIVGFDRYHGVLECRKVSQ